MKKSELKAIIKEVILGIGAATKPTPTYTFYTDKAGNYLAVDLKSKANENGEYVGRTVEINGNPLVVRHMDVSDKYLKKCNEIKAEDIPGKWLNSLTSGTTMF